MKLCRGTHGRESLIDIKQRQITKLGGKFLTEFPDFHSGITFTPVESKRQTENQGLDRTQSTQLRNSLNRVHRPAINRLHRVRKNSKIIGRCDTNSRITVVDTESRMNRWFFV